MSEAIIASAIQSRIQGLDQFASADVTLNDWDILDGPVSGAPYVIIETADEFEITQPTRVRNETYAIIVRLFEHFIDWGTAKEAFKVTRQAVIDEFMPPPTTDPTATPGGEGYMLTAIGAGSAIEEVYDKSVTTEADLAGATPYFLSQVIIFDMETF